MKFTQFRKALDTAATSTTQPITNRQVDMLQAALILSDAKGQYRQLLQDRISGLRINACCLADKWLFVD